MDLSNSNCLVPVNDASKNALGQVVTFDCIPILFSEMVDAALYFAGIIAVGFIIWAGIKYITSGGDPKRAESAKKTLTFAIIGLLLIFFSFAIINFLAFITGSHCLTQFGFQVCNK